MKTLSYPIYWFVYYNSDTSDTGAGFQQGYEYSIPLQPDTTDNASKRSHKRVRNVVVLQLLVLIVCWV